MPPIALARSPRVSALLAAVPTALAGIVMPVLGVIVLYGGSPYGWFGVALGVVMLVLATLGIVLASWSLSLFGGLFALALTTLAAGAASGTDGYILVGVLSLVLVGCGAGLSHQLGQVAERCGQGPRDEGR